MLTPFDILYFWKDLVLNSAVYDRATRNTKQHQDKEEPVRHVTWFLLYTHLLMWTLTVFIFCCCKLVSSNWQEKLFSDFSLSTEVHSGSHWSITDIILLKPHYRGINKSCQKLWICIEALGNLWVGFIIWEDRLNKETPCHGLKCKILKVATSELLNAFWEHGPLGFANMKTFEGQFSYDNYFMKKKCLIKLSYWLKRVISTSIEHIFILLK